MDCRVIWRALAIGLLTVTFARAAEPPPVEFNRDVRPILSDRCFQCHGPDEKQRKTELRLDTEAGAFADHDGTRAIVPRDLSQSELFQRITSTDDNERMPPPKFARQLSPAEIDILKRWIEQGATWQKHWSLIPPQRPELPAVKTPAWCQTPLDHFVLARLEQLGLQPSPAADKATLIRRITLDLTGLPPSVAEVDAFLADTSDGAYEKVVDRLLESPRYGERMATRWLDGARYADTSGYQSDGERYMWRWRDWVIEAYNRNQPFDQFTVDQLAGDLLPNPTLNQRIATGFNRNHRGNAEGGIVPAEYAVEYVVDRVDTTFTVWMGLTMGCARCHDHKFDPLTQREYYEVFSLFNNVPEKGRALKYGNSPPYIAAPLPHHERALAQLDAVAKLLPESAMIQAEIDAAQAAWEPTVKIDELVDRLGDRAMRRKWVAEDRSGVRLSEDEVVVDLSFDLPVPRTPNKAISRDGLVMDVVEDPKPIQPPRKLRPGETDLPVVKPIPPKIIGGAADPVAGPVGQAFLCDGTRFYQAGSIATFGFYDSFTGSCWIQPAGLHDGTILSKMTDVADGDGWYLRLTNGRLQVHLVKRYLDDALRVETVDPLLPDKWQHVAFSYSGSRTADGVTIFVDGRPVPVRVLLDELNQDFASNEPLRVGGGGGPDGRFHGLIDEVRIFSTVLDAEAMLSLVATRSLKEILAQPVKDRSPAEALKLHRYFIGNHLPLHLARTLDKQQQLRDQRAKILTEIPTVMVMEELPTPRPTHILLRGEYDKPGELVTPAVPANLAVGERPPVKNRLDFARWLVSPQHPLTARVAVNRAWQMYFGTGLVRTVDDLGAQGEWPSHPELLDWLATEFIRSGWNVKQLQKLIVMSATYRQSSKVTPELWQRDPENRLLARGPRVRLSAEMIRDQALFASGLMIEQQGGPSVLPYQPEGLWKDLTGTDFTPEHGASLYRRSLYTFWKRTVAPPGMVMFDASTREACTVRETRTNTPLQALNLMNDVTYVEAARVLAQRAWREGGSAPAERLAQAFQLVLARQPKPVERDVIMRAWDYHRNRFENDPTAAQAFVKQGESEPESTIPPVELAAYTAVTQMLLNLDEAVTKQ